MSIENPEKYKEFKTETLIDVINSCSFTVENYKRFIQEKSDYLDKSIAPYQVRLFLDFLKK